MFRPRPMAQVEILLLRKDLGTTLRTLAAARIIHLCPLEAGREDGFGEAVPDTGLDNRQRNFVLLLQQIANQYGWRTFPGRQLDPAPFAKWEAWAEKLAARLQRIEKRRAEIGRLQEACKTIDLFLAQTTGPDGKSPSLRSLRRTELQIGSVATGELERLTSLPREVSVYRLGRIGGRTALALIALSGSRQVLDQGLSGLSFHPAALPGGGRKNLAASWQRRRQLQKRLRLHLAWLNEKEKRLERENQGFLCDRLATIEAELCLHREAARFAYSQRTVALAGWVPRQRMGELRELLDRVCPGRNLVRERAALGDQTPILFLNPRWLRPFQTILAALDLPAYGEVEPTPFLAFSFILLFGMMFGDLGHGLVLIATGLALRHNARWNEAGAVLVPVGCSAALFGILFGSFFGWEGLFPPLWFSPLHDIPRLMLAALAVGVGLMTTGMVLRILNGLGREPVTVILTDRFGVSGLVFYLGSLVLGTLAYRASQGPELLYWLLLPLLAIFLHPFTLPDPQAESFLLRCAEGGVEVLETVLGFLANTFSFLRVAAFGLAHVGLSMAVFALADQALALRLGYLPVVVVHLVGNLVILLLEGLIVSIQAVRLEFYEFFGKFFRGGGIAFRPLALDTGPERRF